MGKTNFTKMQQAAIDLRGKNILVSAAAGSGKTSVLVERIINRILDDENPIDIDRILVMTFTRAAASQMKEKILNAINEKRSENPHDSNLNKQYALVHNASITTIDSFCMSVVRNHFGEINISPDFRMADEGEIRLLKQDVLEDTIEKMYEEASDDFFLMTEIFSLGKTDINIENIVLSLYEYAISYPDPKSWLRTCADEYNISIDEKGGRDPEWLEQYVVDSVHELKRIRKILDGAGDICKETNGPLPYLSAIESDIVYIDTLMNGLSEEDCSYSKLYEKFDNNSNYKYETLKRITLPKEGSVSDADLEEMAKLKLKVKTIRDTCKDRVLSLIKTVTSMSPETISNGMKMMKGPVCQLVSLVEAFMDALSERKREKNIVDFNDIEHMCLRILKEGRDTTALEYSEFFEEIYVDEYQDSNFVQEEILNLISTRDEKSGNVFMVGDVKQSIYGFRMAKPEIFVDKYEKYSKYSDVNEGTEVRIDLSDNFRSRKEVLNSVNDIFANIMSKSFGGIDYDDAAALHPGREYINTVTDYSTELNLMIKDSDVPDKEAQALMVADKIKDIMKNYVVEDGGVERKVKYSDIVILLRTAKGWDNVFMKVLEEQGIPVFVTSTTGYFESMEITCVLNFLKIIDNPIQDIPLAATMMSIIGGFLEEEVALIRGCFKNGSLYDALENYSMTYSDNENKSLLNKVKKFIGKLEYYRDKAEYCAVSDILTEIIDGDFGRIVRAMPGGTKKYANLNMLLRKAEEYGKTSYKGIFHFNRYIEAIRKYDIDYGEANISDENDDTIRIMSIHKSKGLEFPICFLCGMDKKINVMDTKTTVLTDSKYGLATDFIDISKRLRAKSLFKTIIAKKKQSEIIAEEMRVLYVAMTRAKEKLIMTGTVKDAESIENSMVSIDKASSYFDMYLCAADDGEVPSINVNFTTVKDLVDISVKEAVDEEISRNKLLELLKNGNMPSSDILDRFNFVYPYVDKGNVKLSVSELKHRSDLFIDQEAADNTDVTTYLYDEVTYNSEETENNEHKYAYEPGQKNKAALHGTAVHRIFELWDYSLAPTMESVESFICNVKEQRLMEDELIDLVRNDEVYDFVTSDIAKRMAKAYKMGELYREQPFVISLEADDPESLLVQGIIDAYFVEDGKIVLVDYKTDKGKNEEQLKMDHSTQLKYYGEALSRLLHLEIKQSVIYSTYLRKTIII